MTPSSKGKGSTAQKGGCLEALQFYSSTVMAAAIWQQLSGALGMGA